MKCKGWYYLGNPSDKELLGNGEYTSEAKRYEKPVQLRKGEEWAYGSCSDPNIIEGVAYRNMRNPEVVNQVQAKMKQQQDLAFAVHQSNETRPLTVLYLVLDSVSREYFYRSLPRTLSFLQSLSPTAFKVFDFKTHNVVGDNSISNQYPTWTGEKYPYLNESQIAENIKNPTDLIESKAIWTYLRE